MSDSAKTHENHVVRPAGIEPATLSLEGRPARTLGATHFYSNNELEMGRGKVTSSQMLWVALSIRTLHGHSRKESDLPLRLPFEGQSIPFSFHVLHMEGEHMDNVLPQ